MTRVLIEAQDIQKWFYTDGVATHLLKDITLSIESNTTYAIMGRSGAGKTTLLQILATLDAPTDGTLLYEGKTISAQKADLLRSLHFGFVFQFFYLLEDRSLLENVLLPAHIAKLPTGPSTPLFERAIYLLTRCGLIQKKEMKACHLSGGEKQRASVARALLLHPQILFLDEPTGSLDKENEKSLMSLLFETAREEGATLLMVTHNEDLAAKAAHRYRLDEGHLLHKV